MRMSDETASGVAGAGVLLELFFGGIISSNTELVKPQDFQIGLKPIHDSELGKPGQAHQQNWMAFCWKIGQQFLCRQHVTFCSALNQKRRLVQTAAPFRERSIEMNAGGALEIGN